MKTSDIPPFIKQPSSNLSPFMGKIQTNLFWENFDNLTPVLDRGRGAQTMIQYCLLEHNVYRIATFDVQ